MSDPQFPSKCYASRCAKKRLQIETKVRKEQPEPGLSEISRIDHYAVIQTRKAAI
jgi:hypothetical protein